MSVCSESFICKMYTVNYLLFSIDVHNKTGLNFFLCVRVMQAPY